MDYIELTLFAILWGSVGFIMLVLAAGWLPNESNDDGDDQ